MECHNKEVAHVLQAKMEAVLTAFAVPVESALDAHTLAKGSKRSRRREAIQEARKIIQNTQRKVAAISQQSDAISRKRKETMQQMKENKISFYSSLQQLIQHYNNFRHLQNLLGRKEVAALSSDAIRNMDDRATRLDDAMQPLSTLPTPMAANQGCKEKEERRLVVPNLSPLWTYHTAEKKWQYKGFFQFKAARKNLQYYQAAKREEEEKYDPAVLLRAYLPKTAPKAQRRHESAFDYQIRIRYDVAATLKNTMVYPVSFNKVLARNHGRAARLVLCKEMLAIFEQTVNNELLSEAAIEKMSRQLAKHFEAQKEIFNGPFNNALKQLQFNLAVSTQHAILGHSNLAQIDAWIESGVKKTRLEEDLAEIEAQATRLNCLQEYPLLKIKTRQKLNAYIANEAFKPSVDHSRKAHPQEMSERLVPREEASIQTLLSAPRLESKEKNERELEQAYRQAKAIQSTIKRMSGIQFTEADTDLSNAKEEYQAFFNEILTLIMDEKKMPCSSEETMVNKIIEAIKEKVKAYGGTISHRQLVQQYAYQMMTLLHIYTAADTYQTNPSLHHRKELFLAIESAIKAVEYDEREEKFGRLTTQEGYGKILQNLLQIVYVPSASHEEREGLSHLFNRLEKCIEVQHLKKIEAEEAAEHRLVNKQLKKETRAEVDAIQSALDPYVRSLELSQSHLLLSSLASIQSFTEIYRTTPVTRQHFLEHVKKVINTTLTDNRREKWDSPERVYRKALQKILYALLDSPLTKGEERMDIVALSDQLDSYIITVKQQKEAEMPVMEQQAEGQMQHLAIPK
jgi:hypothetical protein